jgi:hypothetical protein
MRFQHEIRYDAAPDDVFAMLGETSFREEVCKEQGLTDCTVRIDTADATLSVDIAQTRSSEGIPGFARKFVGDEIHIRQREDWSGATDAALEVTIPGKPGHLTGTVTLRPDGTGTVHTISGELKVSIPMVGGKIESLIAELLHHALEAEQRVGARRLAGRS